MSYYVANRKELEQLTDLDNGYSLYSPLRTTTITSLCVKDNVFMKTVWSTLETQLQGRESLQKVYFCMRVGEEIGYIEFLFLLPHMSRCVIEFLDNSHWRIRLQRSEEGWKI